MTYPPSGSGYPPGQQPTTQFSAPTQQFGKVEQPRRRRLRGGRRWSEQAAVLPARRGRRARPARLPVQLRADVHHQQHRLPAVGQRQRHVAGSRARRARFASCRAARRSGPAAQAEGDRGVVAAISVLAFLLVIAEIVNKPEQVSIDWALYVVIASHLPAGGGRDRRPAARRGHHLCARAAAEVRAAAAVRPVRRAGPVLRGQHAPHQGGAPQQQRPGYPSQYGGYPGGSASGGFSAIGQQGGPPTPPTGFPTYGQPQASQLRANRAGSGTAAAVVFVGSVRPRAVVVRASRA